MTETQNYANHTRILPSFHYGVFLPLLVNFLWTAYRLVVGPTIDTAMGLLVSVTLILIALSLRGQIITVQDRVIRLEMRLRLRDLLPAAIAARAMALPVKQVVALRFASDAELPGIVGEVLDGRLGSGKAIKLAVKDWQADRLRA